MSNFVKVVNGKVVTDSLTIADLFGKEHKNVLSDIRKQIEYAGEEFGRLNFEPSSYVNSQNKEMPMIELTEEGFTLIAMSYNTKEAVQTKIKFIQEFKRMKDYIQNGVQPLRTERERLEATLKMSMYLNEDVTQLKEDVSEIKQIFEKSLTIDYGEQNAIRNNVNQRVAHLWNNNIINYNVHDTKKKVYSALWKDIKNAFAVASYRDIKKKDFDEAVSYVKAWRPKLV